MTQNNIEMVPLAAFEAQAERNVRTVKYMSLGWVISVILLTFALMVSMSYTEETMEEIVTTTTEVDQAADNYGSNYFANGDMTNGSEADSEANGSQIDYED